MAVQKHGRSDTKGIETMIAYLDDQKSLGWPTSCDLLTGLMDDGMPERQFRSKSLLNLE